MDSCSAVSLQMLKHRLVQWSLAQWPLFYLAHVEMLSQTVVSCSAAILMLTNVQTFSLDRFFSCLEIVKHHLKQWSLARWLFSCLQTLNISVIDRTVKWQHFPPVTLLVLVLVLQ